MTPRGLAAFLAAAAVLGVAAPTALAAAQDNPAPTSSGQPVFTFIPPRVGPLQVMIAPVFIGGKMISQGVNVATTGTSLPPITWSPPAT
jgi:hypothetical protein